MCNAGIFKIRLQCNLKCVIAFPAKFRRRATLILILFGYFNRLLGVSDLLSPVLLLKYGHQESLQNFP